MYIFNPYLRHYAKITGGLHGRVSGSIGGIVYSSARTRTGKVVTAREWVMPKEITDSDVLKQRIIFACSVYACRYLGSGLWQDNFNRSIGQLPGFQSMMSIILKNTDRDTRDFSAPPNTPLGSLYTAGITFTQHGSVGGSITASWSTALGPDGTAADIVNFFGIQVVGSVEGVRGAVDWSTTAIRGDGSVDIPTGSSTTDWIAAAYFQGQGIAVGLLSECNWQAVTSL